MGGLVACLGERPLELPLSAGHLGGLSFERLNRSVDAEWLENAQNLRANGLIHSEATEGDTPLGAMVHDGTLAVVAARLAVAHVHLSPAMAPSSQPRRYKLTPPCRTTGQ